VTNGAVGGDKTYDWKTMEEAQTQGTPLNMPLEEFFKKRSSTIHTQPFKQLFSAPVFVDQASPELLQTGAGTKTEASQITETRTFWILPRQCALCASCLTLVPYL